jgi:hypothetical protein
MSKVDKKKNKLTERITALEQNMASSLAKKSSATVEINVPETLRKIAELKAERDKL